MCGCLIVISYLLYTLAIQSQPTNDEGEDYCLASTGIDIVVSMCPLFIDYIQTLVVVREIPIAQLLLRMVTM